MEFPNTINSIFVHRMSVVSAVRYEPGMEDGIECIKDCNELASSCDKCSWNTNTPYITTPKGNLHVNKGDYITKDVNDGIYVYDSELFNRIFIPVTLVVEEVVAPGDFMQLQAK